MMIYEITEEQVAELRELVRAFGKPRASRRILSLLETRRGQQTVMRHLDHASWFDTRFLIPPNQQLPSEIRQMLAARGASRCHVLSTNSALNDKWMMLDDALSKVLGGGNGTILVFQASRLAYYEAEGPGSECYLLTR